jgi:OmpA-OmpF porin, OOP family
MKNVLLVFACFCLSFNLLAFGKPNAPDLTQIKTLSPQKISKTAKKLYKQHNLNEAYLYYLALSQVRSKLNSTENYRLGKAALFVGDYQIAEPLLRRASNNKNFPLARFEYANVLKNTGEFHLAIQQFEIYIQQHSNDVANDYLAISKEHIKTCQQGLRDLAILQLNRQQANLVNSKATGQTRAFTPIAQNGAQFAEYETENGTSIKKVDENGELVDMETSVGDEAFHSAAPCISPDGTTIYFMRPETNAQGLKEYKIYSAQRNINGDLVNVQRLGSGINKMGHSSMHPAAAIQADGQEILYFSSTMAGGNGGYDIWYAYKLNNGDFSNAYHLGMRINSSSDEITPFYWQENQELFFSSNKQADLDGFNVYQITGEPYKWVEDQPILLPAPINSIYNDIFYRQDAQNIYITTNRVSQNKEETLLMPATLRYKVGETANK